MNLWADQMVLLLHRLSARMLDWLESLKWLPAHGWCLVQASSWELIWGCQLGVWGAVPLLHTVVWASSWHGNY